MLIKIVGRRTEDALVIGKFATLETGVFKRRIAESKVKAALDQIELRIGQPQVETDTGVQL